jgi:hypothetical protein
VLRVVESIDEGMADVRAIGRVDLPAFEEHTEKQRRR